MSNASFFDDHLPAPDPELLAFLSSPLSDEDTDAVEAVWREAQIQRSRQCLSELAQEVADCWQRNFRARAEGDTEAVELEAALLPTLHAEIRRHLHNIEQMEGIFCTPARMSEATK